jgi:ATP-binding cassette subfamily B protein
VSTAQSTPDADADAAEQPADVRVNTGRIVWRLAKRDPVAYALAVVLWGGFHVLPIPAGWAFKLVLDRVSHGGTAASPWGVLALMGGFEMAQWSVMLVAIVQWSPAWIGFQTIPRLNAMKSLACAPGPAAGRLPSSPGEAVSRFRDDTLDMVNVLDGWIDTTGMALNAVFAIVIMAFIDFTVTAVAVTPILAALVLSRWLGPRLRQWRRSAREAGAGVTSFVGDVFGSVLAVKAAGAESAVSTRFRELNAGRARVAQRDQIGSQFLYTVSGATGELGIGLLLLLVAASARRGSFTVGDLGLFTTYLSVVAQLPRWAGRTAAYMRQAEVSIARLSEFFPEPDVDAVVAPIAMHLRHGPPPLPAAPPRDERFQSLRVEGLTVRYPGGRGVFDVDLSIRQGQLVVLTGEVGTGKSTLLRGLLGLVPVESATVWWNGRQVEDTSMFLVPPRVAYVPQVPRLFSEALADTVLLGWDEAGLDDALWQACLEEDVAAMPAGAATVVGPKGVRLSGGQLQRTAAARAFVRRPELLVIDDISSALDVETEAKLWERLLGGPDRPTALVVTHRPRVLAQADQVITLR